MPQTRTPRARQKKSMAAVTKIKYLTNKDLLEEIHRSKGTYCEYIETKYASYDIITNDLSKVTAERLSDARNKKMDQSIAAAKKAQVAAGIRNPIINITVLD